MNKSIVTKKFRLQAGEKLELGSRPTTVKPLFKSKKQYYHIREASLSNRDDHVSHVANGPLNGRPLGQLLEQWPGQLLGNL